MIRKRKFNDGKSYHGSQWVMNGNLQGRTDTDYFYFFCPRCREEQIMRVLDYQEHFSREPFAYRKHFKRKSPCSFAVVFKLHCEKCHLTDFVKIGNDGFQTGPLLTPLGKRATKEDIEENKERLREMEKELRQLMKGL